MIVIEFSTHPNSRLAFIDTTRERGNLEARILGLMADGKARTDRQIATELHHPEPLRPRITTLIDSNLLHEVGSTVCDVTHKRVRLTKRFI